MRSSRRSRSWWGFALGVAAAVAAGCASSVRVPLAVPLPTVGGARPATPRGLQIAVDFGDGVWGQEQERAEMFGVGVAFALIDRVEVGISSHESTRNVRISDGGAQSGEPTVGVVGKLRLGDFWSDRTSFAVHAAHLGSSRQRSDVQDERLSAWDVALPVEYYPVGDRLVDYRWGIYAGPRLVSQKFEDRLLDVTTTGSMVAALVGTTFRWRHLAIAGEVNIAHTTPMIPGQTDAQGDWILLPMLGLRGIIPL